MSLKNPLTPAGIEPATFRFVAQLLNHCATADGLLSCATKSKGFFHDTWRSTLHSPSHDYQRSCVKTLGSCDNSWCQCIVVCSRECFAVQWCLSWNEWRPLWTPNTAPKASTIWSFDNLCHLMNTHIAKLNISGCYLVTGNYTTEYVCDWNITTHNTEILYVIT